MSEKKFEKGTWWRDESDGRPALALGTTCGLGRPQFWWPFGYAADEDGPEMCSAPARDMAPSVSVRMIESPSDGGADPLAVLDKAPPTFDAGIQSIMRCTLSRDDVVCEVSVVLDNLSGSIRAYAERVSRLLGEGWKSRSQRAEALTVGASARLRGDLQLAGGNLAMALGSVGVVANARDDGRVLWKLDGEGAGWWIERDWLEPVDGGA